MAAFTVSNAGGNWSAGATWVGGIAPANTDTVIFTATSGNLTVDGNRTCAGFDATNFVNTLTVNGTLRVNGNTVLVATMTITTTSGTPVLQWGAGGTHTSNGKAWPYLITHNTVTTAQTLTDAWQCQDFTYGIGANNNTSISDFSMTITRHLTIVSGGNTFGGTTEFILNGTGTFTTGNGSKVSNPITINTAGLVTFSGTSLAKSGTGAFQILTPLTVSGTSSIALTIGGNSNSITVDLQSTVWSSLFLSIAAATCTLSSDINVNGNLTVGFGSNNNATFAGTGKVYFGGNLTYTAAVPTVNNSGTVEFVFSGIASSSVTWSMGAGTINKVNITIAANATATINLTGTLQHNTGLIKYTSGIVNQGTSTLSVADSTTFDTAGMSWYNLTTAKASSWTITLNSVLSVSNVFTITGTGTGNLTFAGTAGFTVKNLFINSSAGLFVALVGAVTYTMTGDYTSTNGTNGTRSILKSTIPGTQAIFTLQGATNTVIYVNATDINSGLGMTVWDLGGTVSNTINWNPYTTIQQTTAYAKNL